MLYIVKKIPKFNKPHLRTAFMVVDAANSREAIGIAQSNDIYIFGDERSSVADFKKTTAELLATGTTIWIG
jgi:hypothetical protein